MNYFVRAFVVAMPFMLVACGPLDPVIATLQSEQAKVEAAIDTGCKAANAAAAVAAPFAAVPQVAGVLTFVTAGCGTSEAVAALVTKAVNDPSTVQWVKQLAGQVQQAVSVVARKRA